MTGHTLPPPITSQEGIVCLLQDHWGCSRQELQDLKIFAVYVTLKGYMVALFLLDEYRLFFLDEHGDTLEWLRFFSADTQITAMQRTRDIAALIGATEQADHSPHQQGAKNDEQC